MSEQASTVENESALPEPTANNKTSASIRFRVNRAESIGHVTIPGMEIRQRRGIPVTPLLFVPQQRDAAYIPENWIEILKSPHTPKAKLLSQWLHILTGQLDTKTFITILEAESVDEETTEWFHSLEFPFLLETSQEHLYPVLKSLDRRVRCALAPAEHYTTPLIDPVDLHSIKTPPAMGLTQKLVEHLPEMKAGREAHHIVSILEALEDLVMEGHIQCAPLAMDIAAHYQIPTYTHSPTASLVIHSPDACSRALRMGFAARPLSLPTYNQAFVQLVNAIRTDDSHPDLRHIAEAMYESMKRPPRHVCHNRPSPELASKVTSTPIRDIMCSHDQSLHYRSPNKNPHIEKILYDIESTLAAQPDSERTPGQIAHIEKQLGRLFNPLPVSAEILISITHRLMHLLGTATINPDNIQTSETAPPPAS